MGNGPTFCGVDFPREPLPLTACILLLPLCLLDEHSLSTPSISPSDLRDNGYSDLEISKIFADQKILLEKLSGNGKRLGFENNETRQSIATGLKSVYPEISDDYLNFLSESRGL